MKLSARNLSTAMFSTLLLFVGTTCIAQTLKLNIPVKGENNRDFFLVNFPDHDTTAGIFDYFCRARTYDGHWGTDFVLRDFSAMDSGVTVIAAAPGKVIKTVDGLFDRSKATNDGQFGNYVAVQHGDGSIAFYAHLRKNSIVVSSQQDINVGDVIGLIGSSGNSTDPHLHFELRLAGKLVDPWSGDCNPGESKWATQPNYDTAMNVIDAGFLNYTPTLDTLRERPPTVAVFTPSDADIWYWIHTFSIRKGDTSSVSWYLPNGKLYFHQDYIHKEDYRYSWWWFNIHASSNLATGEWKIEYRHNGSLKRIDFFEFAEKTTSAEFPISPVDANLQILYPNPIQRGGKAYIRFSALKNATATIRLTDVLGKTVKTLEHVEIPHTEQILSLDISDIPGGLYHCAIYSNNAAPVILPLVILE